VSVVVTVVAPAPPERTWALLSDVPGWPEWNPSCLEAVVDGPLAPGTKLDLRLQDDKGRSFYTRPRVTTLEPEQELAWEARGLGLRAATRVMLGPEPDGTRVTIEAMSSGPLAITYRLSVSEKTQALIYVAMLDALSERLRP
jgi:uncharacterized protein YndB with AHSA1/START domain